MKYNSKYVATRSQSVCRSPSQRNQCNNRKRWFLSRTWTKSTKASWWSSKKNAKLPTEQLKWCKRKLTKLCKLRRIRRRKHNFSRIRTTTWNKTSTVYWLRNLTVNSQEPARKILEMRSTQMAMVSSWPKWHSLLRNKAKNKANCSVKWKTFTHRNRNPSTIHLITQRSQMSSTLQRIQTKKSHLEYDYAKFCTKTMI